jgi:transcriptional regulator with XRE-family HTH domain
VACSSGPPSRWRQSARERIIAAEYVVSDKIFGSFIAQRRRELRLTQKQLADRLCDLSGRATTTRHEISRYERQTRIASAESLRLLSMALDVSQDALERMASVARARRPTSHYRQASDPKIDYKSLGDVCTLFLVKHFDVPTHIRRERCWRLVVWVEIVKSDDFTKGAERVRLHFKVAAKTDIPSK